MDTEGLKSWEVAFITDLKFHAENPPESWHVKKTGGSKWGFFTKSGVPLGSTYPTKKAAQESIRAGSRRKLWEEKNVWYRQAFGEPYNHNRDRELTEKEKGWVREVLSS